LVVSKDKLVALKINWWQAKNSEGTWVPAKNDPNAK
jgi:hypothetical protein